MNHRQPGRKTEPDGQYAFGESIPAAGEMTLTDNRLCGASFGAVTREASTGLTIRRGCKYRRRTSPPVGWANDYAVHWSKQKIIRVGSDTAAAILEADDGGRKTQIRA